MHVDSSDNALGRRIVIWGATGSGKTTLGRRLSKALNLHRVDLDEIRHARGFESVEYDEFRERLTTILDEHSAGGWVVSGSYSEISDVYLSRADTLIWLNMPWRISFWRLFKRTVVRAYARSELYPGSPARESWRLSFFSRRSILLWSVTHYRSHVERTRSRLDAMRDRPIRIVELRSAREVAALLRSVEDTSLIDSSLH